MITQDSLNELASKLFQLFSRTEYALKMSGYNTGDGIAKADWRSFAFAVENLIENPSDDLRQAIDFLSENPPKRQMIVNGQIVWEDAAPQTDLRAEELLIYVRRVRNNLFHGGKFSGHWFEPERSEALLKSSLDVLRACINEVPDVHQAFHG